jgi:hypothetical protein
MHNATFALQSDNHQAVAKKANNVTVQKTNIQNEKPV